MRWFSRSLRHGITLACAISVVACAPRTRRTPDDTLIVISQEVMTSSDPRYALSTYDAKLAKLVHAGLTAVDTPSLEPRLELAARIDQVDDLTYDVTIKPDARFSDGTAVTATDVARSYHAVIDKGSDSLFHRGFVERYVAVEPRTPSVVRFRLVKPFATFRSDIDYGISSYHGVPAGQPLASGAGRGAGPYVLRELTSTVAYLDANPHYLTPAKTPHVEIRFVKNDAARMLMLVGGSADLIQNSARQDLIDDVAERPRIRVATSPSVLLTYMMMNNTDPVLRDVRVRRAIALALDRPSIIAAKFSGRAVLATGLLPPTHWAYEGEVTRYPHDLARARALLDEAGLPDPDGAGPKPRLALTYKTSTDAFRVTIAKVLAAQLAEVGIAVEVRSFEFATFFTDVKKGNYQLATMQTGEITEPDLLFTYFHSSRIPDQQNPDGGNRWRYRNSEVDLLTARGRHELDPATRKRTYGKAQQLIAEDVPIVPLWHEDNIVLSNVDVEGYVISPNARLVGLIHAWKRP